MIKINTVGAYFSFCDDLEVITLLERQVIMTIQLCILNEYFGVESLLVHCGKTIIRHTPI